MRAMTISCAGGKGTQNSPGRGVAVLPDHVPAGRALHTPLQPLVLAALLAAGVRRGYGRHAMADVRHIRQVLLKRNNHLRQHWLRKPAIPQRHVLQHEPSQTHSGE